MLKITRDTTCFPIRPLGQCVEVLDRLRRPINSRERANRLGEIPYYGANGQVGWIDKWLFDEELVLVAEDGGFFEDEEKPISYRISGKAWVNNHAHVLRALPDIESDWLNYCISFQDVRGLTKGATRAKLNQAELVKIPIPVPPLSEQQRVVARIKECMDRLDEVECLRAQSRAETLLLAGSCMEALEEVGKYPTVAISNLISGTQNGRSIRPDNVNGNGFVLSIRAVHSVSLDVSARKPAVIPEATAKGCRICSGDVFVSRANTMELVGLASVASESVQERTIYPDLLIKLTAKRDVCLPRYLAYALRIPASRRQIQDRAVGSSQSMVKISAQRLKEVTIPLPSLEEQERLVEKFDEIQLVATQIQEAMRSSELGSIRASVLRKAFAGGM